MSMTPAVVDISHHNTVKDFGATKAAGIVGVIHKSSQGFAYPDTTYAPRRKMAAAAGLLWGAYHFGTGDNVATQVEWFLKNAQPDDKTLVALDFEDNRLSQMNIEQALEFLHLIEAKLGRKAALYSGNRLKQTIGDLALADRAYIASHRLWLCQYGPVAHIPFPFTKWWLWQFTGDGVGPLPHNVPGIISGNNGLDINTYAGTAEQLAKEWV